MGKVQYLALSGSLLCVALGSGCPAGTVNLGLPDLAIPDAGADLAMHRAPTLSAVTPGRGSTVGGGALTLDGQNFAAGAMVSIAGAAATQVSVISETRITA